MWNENLFFDGGERYTVGGGFEKCGCVGVFTGRARNVQILPGRLRTVPYLRTGKPPKRLPDGQASMRISPVAAKAIPTGNVAGENVGDGS